MTVEPLKKKESLYFGGSFSREDVTSAVEYLKREIKLAKQKWASLEVDDVDFLNLIDNKIDEAFEDVVKK